MLRPHSIVSLLFAFMLGFLAAMTLALRSGDDAKWLEKIVESDAEKRQQAWVWLTGRDEGASTVRAQGLLSAINDMLDDASGEVLFDATAALRSVGFWGWPHQDHALVLREALQRAQGEEVDMRIAIEQMADAPLDLPEQDVVAVYDAIFKSGNTTLRDEAMPGIFGWYGPEQYHRLPALRLLADEDSRRMVRIAVTWGTGYAMRGPNQRAWAAFDAQAAMAQLEQSVVDEHGHVYIAALLAEHSLERPDASALARRWIVHLDNDRKRAGALLAALLGEHESLLAEAFDASTDPQVRTAMRLALHAFGQSVGEGDPMEFAYRAMHTAAGQLNPDTMMYMLIMGHEQAPYYLAKRPSPATVESIRPRNLLIERFLPTWHVQYAVEDGEDHITAYYDALWTVWMIMHRHQRFDPQRKQYR
jgi:hypothetical protein